MEVEEPLLPPPTTPSSPAKDPPEASASASADFRPLDQGHLSPLLLHRLPHARKSTLRRSRTAPALAVPRAFNTQEGGAAPALLRPDKATARSVMCHALMLLILYLALGTVSYFFNRHHFSGKETSPVVDSLYFCIVTLCTIGYGDITPRTPAAKALSCVFVLVGFGFLDIFLSGAVNHVLDLQEDVIVAAARGSAGSIVFDAKKGRMRIRMKVGLALGAVVLSIGVGALVLFLVEKMDWVDSFYLSVMSVTTVGYGDKAFKTLPGRIFASVWLLVSTLVVARSFLYLAEARIDKRHRRIAKWVLQRDMTVEDLVAADINNTGFVSKSEYVIFKLKEMGKIGDKDVLPICDQFEKLDPNNCGKITLPNLLNYR